MFIDNMFWSFTMKAGITWTPTQWRESSADLVKAEEFYQEFIGPDIAYPTDAVFMQPAGDEVWNDMRRMCFLRLRVSSVGLSLATTLIDRTERLKLTINKELHDQ